MTTENVDPAPIPSPQPDPDAFQDRGDVALDLDTLERESRPGPFTFQHAGRRWMLSDPQEMDWKKVVLALSDYGYFLRQVLPADDVEAFLAAEMPVWKIRILMQRFQEHYGIPSVPESGALPR